MKILKNIGTLAFGTALSQSIMLVGIIFLSRLYTPDDFGLYALIFGVSSILSSVSSFKYEMTILLPKRKHLVQLAVKVSFLSCLCVNSLSLIFVVFLVLFDIIESFWIVFPFSSLSISIINIATFLQNRKKKYYRMVGIQISRSIIFLLIAVFCSSLSFKSHGLIFAMLFSAFFPAVFVILKDFREEGLFVEGVSRRKIVFWMKRNRKFFYYSTPAVFINSLASQAPVILLAFLFNSGVSGYYSMVQRVVMAPVKTISSGVNKVYIQSVTSNLSKGEKIFVFTKSMVIRLAIPSVAISIAMLVFFKNEYLEYIYGHSWEGIDSLALLLVPAFAVSFVAKSVAGFSVVGRNELGLLYQIALLISVSVSIWVVSLVSESIITVFGVISVVLFLCYLGQLISILVISKNIDESGRKR